MRLPSIRRRCLPAAVDGGLAAIAVSAVLTAAVSVAGLVVSGGPAAAATTVTASRPDATATVPASQASSSAAGQPAGAGLSGATPTHLVVPDLIATAAGGVTAADLAKIRKLGSVRSVLAIDGAQIEVNGKRLTVLAASAARLRAWTPPATAASTQTWSAFAAGQLITTASAAAHASLSRGHQYPVAAAVNAQVTEGGTALLGVTGVDGIVSAAEGAKLGLVRNVAVLVNAPAANLTALDAQVQAALGSGARVVRLVATRVSTNLPVDRVPTPAVGHPGSYLQLFKDSAARYCPGMSWTVLAAIGQIESGDGQNLGPSSAGALGPMQFEPSTWAIWGTDGFGDTGPPDIMNPYDAVPSAARMLCADGAASSTTLRGAIFSYNHAGWYVDEVLALAAEYAREYS